MARHNDLSGLLFIVSAPSGAGKTSLVYELTKAEEDIEVSVSHTTRPKREGEVDGVNYHFVDVEIFNKMVTDGLFLEHAKVFGNYYGTSQKWVEERMKNGQNVILEIDWQGAEQVRKQFPQSLSIFILPPSYQTLKNRLVGRGDENDAVIERRMKGALGEIVHFSAYQFIIINDDFQSALDDLRSIIHSSNHDVRYQPDYYRNFAEKLLKEAE